MIMTKSQAFAEFKASYSDFKTAVKRDKIAVKEDWHAYTDSLCKDGRITTKQYNNWSNPF
jgi:hypothetical protein